MSNSIRPSAASAMPTPRMVSPGLLLNITNAIPTNPATIPNTNTQYPYTSSAVDGLPILFSYQFSSGLVPLLVDMHTLGRVLQENIYGMVYHAVCKCSTQVSSVQVCMASKTKQTTPVDTEHGQRSLNKLRTLPEYYSHG